MAGAGRTPWLDADLLRQHVLWAWSRTPDQVRFTKRAETAIFKTAEFLATKFGQADRVPLCNPSELPDKLARIAVGHAALAHSVTPDHECVVVKEHLVHEAASWLEELYMDRALDLAGLVSEETGRTSLRADELGGLIAWIEERIRSERVRRPGAKAKSTTVRLLRHFARREIEWGAALAEVLGVTGAGLRKKLKPYLDKDLLEKHGAGGYARTPRLLALLHALRDRTII